jgi:diketogulonate reductase-like aldo/keto reductase
MIDNIKTLWEKLGNDGEKTKVILAISEKCNRSPRTVRTHWMSESGFWSIPESQQSSVVEILQAQILNKHI